MFKFLSNLKWNVMLGVGFIFLSFMVNLVYAEEPLLTEAELVQRAESAYNSYNWIDAVRYLTAYIQRDPDVLQDNSDYAAEIQTALETSLSNLQDIHDQRNLCFVEYSKIKNENVECKSAALDATFIEVLPTPLSPPPSSTPATFQLLCRGGGGMSFTYTAASELSTKPQVWLTFDKASFGVGNDREYISNLTPGQCSWLDRGIGPDEPNRIVIKEPVLTPKQFAINWSQDGVKRIQGQAVAAGNSPKQPSNLLGSDNVYAGGDLLATDGTENTNPLAPVVAVDNLQSSDWVQAFDVYNDAKGNFIVAKVGNGFNLTIQPNSNDEQNTFVEDDLDGISPDFQKLVVSYDDTLVHVTIVIDSLDGIIYMSGTSNDMIRLGSGSFTLNRDNEPDGHFEESIYSGPIENIFPGAISIEIPKEYLPDISEKRIWGYSMQSQDRIPDEGELRFSNASR